MNYIDSWFHFYDTTESFEQHRDKGLINPDSICFIKESGQVYTQNSFFGICRERYEELEQLAKELEDRFGETLAAIEQFERDINADFNEFKELVGAPDGIAPLDRDAKVPSAYLPSYVDDVLEYATKGAFPVTGETGKIYVSLDDNLTYRWSGSTYIEISKSLGLGETSSTAYPGSKGKKNADDIAAHKIDYSNPHRVTKVQVGLGNVDNTSDLDKPVSNAAKTEFDSIKTRMNDLENNASLSYELLQGNFEAFASEVSEAIDTKVDKVEGKGLSTNDFTNEDKTKLTSALTSTSIISADKVSGNLSNATINASKIIDWGGQGELITGVIGGDRIHGLLRNAYMEGSRVSGELTNANININRVNKLNDVIGSSSNGSEIYYYVKAERLSGISNATIIGSKVSGNLSMATISGSRIYDNINGTIISGAIKASRIQGNLVNAEIHANKIGDTIDGTYVLGAIDGSRLRKNISNATIGGSQVKGKLYYATIDGSNVSGHLSNATIDGSHVSGHLSNATIDASNVSGLADFIPTGGEDSTGIIEASRVSGRLINAVVLGSTITGTINTTVKGSKIIGTIDKATIEGSKVSGHLTNASIHMSRVNGLQETISAIASNNIDASRVSGNLTNATIQGSNIEGYINVDKLQDTINDVVTVGKINAANISGGFLDNVLIPASTIHGELTNATINASNIEGNLTAESILADYSITSTHLATGAVLPENIASGNLASGVKVNVNSLVGNISAGKLQGNIDKERMRSGFLELCEEYKVVRNNSISGTN